MNATVKKDDTKRFLIQGVVIGLITHLGLGLFFSIEHKTYKIEQTASSPIVLIPLSSKDMTLQKEAASWVDYNNPTMLAKSTVALDFGKSLSPQLNYRLKQTKPPTLKLEKMTRFDIKRDCPVTADLNILIPLRDISMNTIITEPTAIPKQPVVDNSLTPYPYLQNNLGEILDEKSLTTKDVREKIEKLKPKNPTYLMITIGDKESLPRITIKRSSGVIALDQLAIFSVSHYLRRNPTKENVLYMQIIWRAFLK